MKSLIPVLWVGGFCVLECRRGRGGRSIAELTILPPNPNSSRSSPYRKTLPKHGLRLEQAMMREVKHLGVDEDKPMNDLVEEALRDLLKKYRERRKDRR